MNIVLFGYRGCGKTTVGRLVAERRGWPCVDTDDRVRERFGGATIRAIWHEHGERAFRDAEAAVVRELLAGDGQVIALGGGAAIQPAGREALAAAAGALRVYLVCEAGELHRRITTDASRQTRPSHGGPQNQPDAVAAQLAERDPAYRAAADHVVDVTRISAEQAAAIVEALAGDAA